MSDVSDVELRRSPHLVLHWQGDRAVLINGNTLRSCRIRASAVTALSGAADWTSRSDLVSPDAGLEEQDVTTLVRSSMLEVRSALDGDDLEMAADGHPANLWDSFELAVHRRGNVGGARKPPLASPPPPAFKLRPNGPATSLPEPDEALETSLSDALTRRRSVRAYGDRPLAEKELSTLLHHSARIVRTARDPVVGDLAFRPFASAGARSELEIYVVANSITGVPRGAHYYDPRRHDLVQVCEPDSHHEHLIRWTHMATGGLNRDPAAVLLVTAVVARVMWKYSGIALSLIYKDMGCLFQTLYLVATAQGLAPCAIGGGHEFANSRWLGLDPLAETQVGCFLVGARDESEG